MKKSSLNPTALLLIATMGLTVSSCVQQEYDLDKEISFKGQEVKAKVGIPLGSTELIKLSDLIDLEGNENVKTEENGDYYFEMKGNRIDQSVKLNEIAVDRWELPNKPSSIFVPGGDRYLKHISSMDNIISISNISDEISQVNWVATNSQESSLLNLSSKDVTLRSGFQIIFPESIILKKEEFKNYKTDKNMIVFTSDVKLNSTGSEFSFSIDSIKPNKEVVDNRISLPIAINFIGKTYIESENSSTMTFQIVAKPMTVTSVNGIIQPNLPTIDNQNIAINGLPDFFTQHEAKLDIDDVLFNLDVNNELPVGMMMKGELVASKKGIKDTPVKIGESPNTITIAANDKTALTFRSRETSPVDNGRTPVLVPGLNKILQNVPDLIILQNIQLNHQPPRTITIDLTKTYKVTVDYGVKAYLAPGSEFYVLYTDSVTGLAGDLKDIDLKSAVITAKVDNQLPLDLEFSQAVPIDAQGKELKGIVATITGAVGGSSSSDLKISLTVQNKDEQQKLDGFALKVKIKGAKSGNLRMNKNQGVQLKDIRVKVEGGYTIE